MSVSRKKVVAEYDGLLTISVGNSRKTKTWKKTQIAWSDLVRKLSVTVRTDETRDAFLKMTKAQQDEIKDIGGFVGGDLIEGRRTALTMGKRQLITLDADYAQELLWDTLEMLMGNAACCYSTHKHSADKPRLRLVIPTNRPMTPDEYQAVSRYIANEIGIDYFDDTTYQPHRLMYWPSTSKDGDFFFEWQDGMWLNVDEVLNTYDDWHDQTSWPVSSRVKEVVKHSMKKQKDPLAKDGIIGAFCRTYTIAEVIEKYLPDVYTPFEGFDDRYTYVAGSSSGGAVVYEDKWLYSHHATDPCSMQLVNAFDLVRIHKFHELDAESAARDVTQLPSYTAMVKLANSDGKVKALIMQERQDEVASDFENVTVSEEKQDFNWVEKLKCNKEGKIIASRANIRIILENDSRLKGIFGWDAFAQRIAVLRQPPWRTEDNKKIKYWCDSDDSELRFILETFYSIDSKPKIEDETLNAANRNTFHHVREYLSSIKWDGVERLDTVFIDYLGAEDMDYTRAVTRTAILAAVGRVMEPGIKFDNMVVLEGPQGIGKSRILKLLGKDWFSDSLDSVQGKEAYEQLRGVWIVEMGELAALKKSDVEPIKQFISKQNDIYRVAYGKRVNEFPRQCVFFGTTNEATFLRDQTGNRRFWPVKCGVRPRKKSLWDENIEKEIDQIWAEALHVWNKGERLWIGEEMEQKAVEIQKAHTEENKYLGMIEVFLDRELPENWYKLDIEARREFLRGDGFEIKMGNSFKRDHVCVLEVWCELLGGTPRNLNRLERQEIREALKQLVGWEASLYPIRFGAVYGHQRGFVLKRDAKVKLK